MNENTDEIVKALRLCAEDEPANCINCPGDSDISSRTCSNKLMEVSADLIESLQAQLAESQQETRAAVDGLTMMRNGNLCASCGAECSSRDRDPSHAASVCLWWENKWRGPHEAGKGEAE